MRTRRGEPIEQRNESAWTVVLPSSVRQAIVNDIAETTAVDGLEAGGGLYGPGLRAGLMTFALDSMTASTREPERRAEASMRLDVAHIYGTELELADSAHDGREALVELGMWHTHPTPSTPEPSCADVDWALKAQDVIDSQRRCPAYLLLIACEGALAWSSDQRLSWAEPDFGAWIVRRDPENEAIVRVERATLSESA